SLNIAPAPPACWAAHTPRPWSPGMRAWLRRAPSWLAWNPQLPVEPCRSFPELFPTAREYLPSRRPAFLRSRRLHPVDSGQRWSTAWSWPYRHLFVAKDYTSSWAQTRRGKPPQPNRRHSSRLMLILQ